MLLQFVNLLMNGIVEKGVGYIDASIFQKVRPLYCQKKKVARMYKKKESNCFIS